MMYYVNISKNEFSLELHASKESSTKKTIGCDVLSSTEKE